MDMPKRKPIRLRDYDYSQNGAYFVTICTHNRQPILCNIAGDGQVPRMGIMHVPQITLSSVGQEIENSIAYMNHRYENIVDKYAIMPNHVHMIVLLTGGHGNPPLQDVIGRIKSFTTRRYNEILRTENTALWQRSYYDHIIRDEEDYRKIWQYIDDNPRKWQEDELHP